MKLLIALLLVIWVIDIYPQDMKERYNLGFESTFDGISDNWQLVLDCHKGVFDTIDRVEGKRSVMFSRAPMNIVLNLCLYQKILLPKPSNKISVSVFSKNINNQNSWIKISGFNKVGKIIVTDSVSIICGNNWEKFSANIEYKTMYILSIELRTKDTCRQVREKVQIWLDNISVYCDGTDLLTLDTPSNEPTKSEIAAIRNNQPMNNDMLLPETALNEIARKKIVGFGETAHGSLDIDRFTYNNIRQLISKYNCRLVLFEKPIDLVAQYDLYIHGYEIDSVNCTRYWGQEKIDTTYIKLSFINKEEERFINWLRDYNAVHEDKVCIMGLDVHLNQLSSNETPPSLNRYISSMKLNSKTVDSLVTLINSGLWRILPLQYALRNEEELSDQMGRFNCMVLLQILKSRTDSALAHPLFKGWSDWQMAHRDYILWQNAKQVLENFIDDNSTVAINAHYAHLNKFTYVHFNEVVPLGQYLAEAYGNDYYHLGILLGQGEAGIKKTAKDSLGIQILQDPIKGSLEYLALQTNQDVFFKQGFVKSDKPLMIRRSGNNRSIFQFIPAYSPECMDGFVFIRNSTSYFKE